MRRLHALLGKELRHHAVAGVALFGCLAAAYLLLLLGLTVSPETVSLLQAHAGFLGFFVPLAAIVLGNRLVTAEYHGRTQLFIEALPVRRWEMVALKFVLGLAVLLAAAGLSLAASALAASFREAVDAVFVGIVAARTAAFTYFLWAFFFTMGLAGRFRVPIYIALLLMLAVVDQMTGFELQRFGPIALMDPNTLPFERETMPTRALVETLALAAGWTALAFALALIHEGSVAEALARRMSQKEKALVGILFTSLMLAVVFLDERRDKEPYAFTQDEVVASGRVPLEVLYLLPERRDDAEALLARLEGDLEALSQMLDWVRLPDVRVAYGPALDASTYDRAELDDNDGILVRANFRRTAAWDDGDFRAYVVGLVLDEATRGRASFEPKAWLRDGFAHWWSRRDEAAPLVCREDFAPALRALAATRQERLDVDRIAAWRRYRERHGEAMAEAVAWSGLAVLAELRGRDAVLSLAREVFGRAASEDFRELFHEWRHPMASVFEATTTLAWSDFVDAWNDELGSRRATAACRAALATVPRGSGSIEVERGEGAVRDVVYRFRFAEPLPGGTLSALLHTRLTPFDSELERHELRRIEHLWPDGERQAVWRLPGRYGRGSRAFLALEVDSAVLGCPLRLAAERREIR